MKAAPFLDASLVGSWKGFDRPSAPLGTDLSRASNGSMEHRMLLHIRLNREAMLMRTRSLIAVGFTLAVGGVNAQALDEPSLERQLAIDPVGPSGARRSPPPVVVDINSLPRARQEEIRRGVAERGEDELHNLRTAI